MVDVLPSLNEERFDETFFSTPVFKIVPANNVSQMEDFFSAHRQQLLHAWVWSFVNVDAAVLQCFQQEGFRVIGVRSEYHLDIQKVGLPTQKESSNITIARLDTPVDPLVAPSQEDQELFALTVLESSRYGRDPLISSSRAASLYKAWVRNSLEGYVQHFFVAKIQEKSAGILTLKVSGTQVSIDLLGVFPDFQRKGVASVLLREAVSFALHQYPKKVVTVVTEGENIPANITYQKAGFIIQKISLVLHKTPSTLRKDL